MSKQVYLTIDDGPSKDFKDKVDFLSAHNIPATFFCLGENLESYENDAAYAIGKGFLIGNHSYSHKHFSDLSIEQAKKAIQITDTIIDNIYMMIGIKRPIKVFRFPHFDQGGDISGEEYEKKWNKSQSEWYVYSRNDRRIEIQSFLRELGYVQPHFKNIKLQFFNDKEMFDYIDVRCTFNQMEYFLDIQGAPYGMEKEEAILGRIDEDVPYVGRALNCSDTADIILTHDHERTTELFYKIINKYLTKNFEFLRIV
ncbi:polysaccharide deacetylase family protein [Herbivorax sp. ANBcel31]|uniref:polysaccharide deacetylase family protein n=1 Tax=Herbivorax sp. ANBcel31 TaxID=3069754 RepID=UPI0027B78357|nr:polysaccharide deacetylase family protein [Herbivorax sp. ANBcel31]MDQ2086321.1 polysaccharide deacetylase family protein [Herbivorax sp. ANBcel31]